MEQEYDGFTLTDAETVCAIYVCSQCEGELATIPTDFINPDGLFYVICPDHGNIELIGRISRTTVAIRNERGIWEFPKAIRALPDLWGVLIRDRKTIMQELGY